MGKFTLSGEKGDSGCECANVDGHLSLVFTTCFLTSDTNLLII
jgi:hypothetical protein